ncbi:MaoC family dehydratase N-terminal domain-containing protein [Microbispora sp. H11081]|uniref:FAS1-like dehydratase domain-containing protein n=1 Tax=Microbispora sp. H11081 TaxID=2729107 RepID=UPI0014753F2B|nr:MaoC family dehydratase N-terminal domain-containing protein [Microbispora sp. H11081]
MSQATLDEQIQARIAPLLGQTGPTRWSARPIELAPIWNFCEAVEDANPVYWDEEAGANSRFGRLIAPPQALMTLTMGPWWLPPFLRDRAAEQEAALGPSPSSLAYGVAREFGFTTATNVTRDEEYLQPFGPGDGRIGQSDRLVHVSPVKKTRVGPGLFLTTEVDFVSEAKGELIARAKNVLLLYNGTQQG